MIISNVYNHLNAKEFLMVNRPAEYQEIQNAIASVDASSGLKISCEQPKLGQVFYSQTILNDSIKRILSNEGWNEKRVDYYVTGDEHTTREIVNLLDKEEQKRIIERNGFAAYSTYNQVDFQKERIAVEVQFGKYFSVAYDLHVKHTFFFARNDIDVGVEIIPTKVMEEHMDSGVSWFENEVTNIIREGRTNPPVPILVLGIEPDTILSKNPLDYSDAELVAILRNSDYRKFREKAAERRTRGRAIPENMLLRIERIEACLNQMGV